MTSLRKLPASRQAKADPVGIQSVEIALDALQAMMRQRGPASLGDLCRETGLQPSKLHRYLVSFVRCGMVSKVPGTALYDLGPTARELGVAALGRFDSYGTVQDRVTALASEIGQTVLLYIWTEQGATLVRQQGGVNPLPMTLRLGSTLPLRRSAVGHVFLAYLPEANTKALVKAQSEDEDEREPEKDLQLLLRAIRRDGYYWARSPVLPGAELLAVPVFELQHTLHSVIGVALPRRSVTKSLKDALIRKMLAEAKAVSETLGDTGTSDRGTR